FLKAWPDRLPDDVAAAIREAGEAAFRDYADDPAIAAFWRPAFDRAARWTAAAERTRREALGVARVLAEEKGAANFAAPGGVFILEARADRIDLLKDGRIAIVDVKTGAPPTKAAIESGADPQMALEAAIALHGAFGPVSGRETAEIAIWQVGGQSAAKAVALDAVKVAAALENAWTGVQTLVAGFDDENTPYLSEPGGMSGYSDYRALARLSDEVEDRA
ncbi:MAG: PD-(D/E)XK nuclease family protein, partial [Alphaproteobacteria bacterium]